MRPFVPLFRDPHLLTIAGNFWPRALDERRFPVTARFFSTEPGVAVLVHSQQPDTPTLGSLVVVHGLEGSSDAGYARSLAQAALERGLAVHRFNMRSCGGTETLSGRTLYHSGQTADLLSVCRQLASEGHGPIYLAGFSLGGNVVLKLAGELGERGNQLLERVSAISTPIDLAACVRNLLKPSNYIYSRRFVARLKERIRCKEALTPGLFAMERLDKVRTVYEFDDWFTAASFGFGSADNYYATQSSNQFLEHIRVPALIVQAQDDPLVPFEVYGHPAFRSNPHLHLVAPEHGGHVGFLARGRPRFWLDSVLVEWILKAGNRVAADFVL